MKKHFNISDNFKSLGFKDMHTEQINTLMSLMNMAADNAGHLDNVLKTKLKDSYLRTLEDKMNDVMIVFGGTGVTVEEDDPLT
jgi:hypothetical protein